MESDDDFQQISPLHDPPSSPIHQRKLKRLKKATIISDVPVSQSAHPIPPSITPDSPRNSDQESLKTLDVPTVFESEKPADSVSESGVRDTVFESEKPADSLSESEVRDLDTQLDDLFVYRDTQVDVENDAHVTKMAVDMEEEGNKIGDEKTWEKKWHSKKRRSSSSKEGGEEKKKKSKKSSSSKEGDEDKKKKRGIMEEDKKKKKSKKREKGVDDKKNSEASARTKKKLEKERKAYLEQLHAESQRLLRETRDAAFKPVLLVQKPISSILEKIRQRKLEVSKKASMLNNHVETDDFAKEVEIDLYPEQDGDGNLSGNEHTKDMDGDGNFGGEHTKHTEKDLHHINEESVDIDETKTKNSSESASLMTASKATVSDLALDEEPKPAFRAPIDDTQELFDDSEQSDGEDLEDTEEDNSVEDLAPSVLAMNLKLDSAPPDDLSSDEENEDKENIDPHPHKPVDEDVYSKGDPVRAFVDDEAAEDDSDDDLMRFKENEEDEENEESEEFNDLIVTGFEEKPSDNAKRDQLHQMWLEQQDAAATDNVLQRLKCGRKQHKEPAALGEVEEVEEDDEDFDADSMDGAAGDLLPATVARLNSRKMKQMIPQMFTDKDDVFLSSDDEETEQKLVRMRLLEKAEQHTSFISPAEDENSREVFGLIKKLNIAPEPKKKATSSSFFDTLITGGNSNSSSKSSFLGRAPSSFVSSSNKNGSSNFRSFIFGRDDSNSRSAITSEESLDVGENSNRSTKTVSAKFSYSQSKFNSQNKTQTNASSSLLEILRKSTQSDNFVRSNSIGETQVAVQFAAFKSGKKPLKVEARS